MIKICRLIALPMVFALIGCGDKDTVAGTERNTAAGEVLGGSISDEMLPLDTVTSTSPPLSDSGDASGNSRTAGSTAAAAADEPDSTVEASQEAPTEETAD